MSTPASRYEGNIRDNAVTVVFASGFSEIDVNPFIARRGRAALRSMH